MAKSNKTGRRRLLVIIKMFLGIFWAFYSLRFKRIWRGSDWEAATRRSLYRSQARRFRLTAVELGGLLIKLGQFFSTRVDMLPQDSIRELSGLQDEVREESFSDIRRVIEAELSCPLEEIFTQFEEKALAAASLGQVHRAVLKDGQTVAVKVQRPGIEDLVGIDLKAIQKVVGFLRRFTNWEQFIDMDAIFEEFATTVWEELDYIQEGKNAETFAANLSTDSDLLIPAIIWPLTTKKVLTMEFMEGMKITDTTALNEAVIDRKKLASHLLQTYIKQVLVDGFFHADPHPGNLFVNQDGKIILIDFGMVGTISHELRDTLAEMVVAMVKRDYPTVVTYLREVGFIRPNADSDALTRALGIFLEHILGSGKELIKTNLDSFLADLEQLLYEQPFQIPANFTFLGRALGTLYGICVGLYPEISFLDEARPYIDELTRGQHKLWDIIKDKSFNLMNALVELPPLAESTLRQAQRGELTVRVPLQTLHQAMEDNTRALRSLTWSMTFGFMLFTGAYLYVHNEKDLAVILFLLSLGALLMALKGSRSRKQLRPPHPVNRSGKPHR